MTLGNLKPENIMITSDYILKITDFNFAKLGSMSVKYFGKVGTIGYVCP